MEKLDKQVYDLTLADLRAYPAWWFPMDETVEDEGTVRPVTPRTVFVPEEMTCIVPCVFEDARGQMYEGYLYPGFARVDSAQPVLFIDDSCKICFWYSHVPPSFEQMAEVRRHLPSAAWPVRYESKPTVNLERISGRLDGLYYLDRQSREKCHRL